MTPEEKQNALDAAAKYTVEDGGCLIWTGRLSCSNGQPKLRNKSMRREYWQATRGAVPKGKYLSVSCENKLCLEHLVLVTRSEISSRQNASQRIRAMKRASSAKAARSKAKLSLDIAREIRASTDSMYVEAKKWGVHPSLIARIRRNEAWREDIAQASPFAGLFTGLTAANTTTWKKQA